MIASKLNFVRVRKGLLYLSFLILLSCSKDFLEKKPLGLLTSDNFFETGEHAIQALNATYEMLPDFRTHVFAYIALTDIISDDADKGSTPSDGAPVLVADEFTFDPGSLIIDDSWQGYYRGVKRANWVISRVPEIDMDAALRDRIVGEAKFLRAYFYFKMVRWWGALPLILEPLNREDIAIPRSSDDQIYASIIQDLTDAAEVLPLRSKYARADLGRATKGAAQGLLAKVYLTIKDYPSAAEWALKVINSGEYTLAENYARIFTVAGENGPGSIFEIQAKSSLDGGWTQFGQVQGIRPTKGWGFNRPSDNLVSSYEPGDPRLQATVLYVGEVVPDGSYVVEDNPEMFNERYNQKAWLPDSERGNGREGGGNIRVLRYADVLLMAAEALNEMGQSSEALTYLNMVRDRARGNLPPQILRRIETADQSQLREIIWKERRAELAMEQHRWFDLLRTGRAESVMKSVGKNFQSGKHELLPIPQSEIDLSAGAVDQNPGY
ncbi:MAG: RagB/SusD family nutrient uptake outer membrane protein [Saprospiraceae bacterium]|nr:RagB/SusD family nutrient uptake outer membrane protein [Saprospiraceae bacterium]